MATFVLRYRGPGDKPPSAREKLAALPDTKIREETPRMLLVDSDRALDELGKEELAALDLENWAVHRDTTVALPDTRFRPKRKP